MIGGSTSGGSPPIFRKLLRIVLATALLAVTAAHAAKPREGTAVGDRPARFTAKLVTLAGGKAKKTDFDSHARKRPTVYVLAGAACPTTSAYLERLRAFEAAYGAKVDFVYVYPNRNDKPETKLAFHEAAKLAGGMIDDQGGKIARRLGAQKTSEVILTDKKGVIVYRGAIDDAPKRPDSVKERYLARALDEHLAGKAVTNVVTQVFA